MSIESLLSEFHGVHPMDLLEKTDMELAVWQTDNKEPVSQILSEREWQRRMISHQLAEQFKLDSRLAEATNQAMRFAAIIGVVGALAGAAIGAFATFKTSGVHMYQQATQQPKQVQSQAQEVQTTPATAPSAVPSQ